MTIFTLPTKGETKYAGKYPTRIRHIAGFPGRQTGQHVELYNGVRLWSHDEIIAEHGDSSRALADIWARAIPMTGEQYIMLLSAARLLGERNAARLPGTQARLDAAILREIESIRPSDAQYAKRNAEAARRELLAEGGGGFDAARPYLVRNRTPQFSGSFTFETLDAAREYLENQTNRRACVTVGAAPIGPDSDSQCPMQSYIIWPGGSMTLAEMGWTPPPADGLNRRWNPPASSPESADAAAAEAAAADAAAERDAADAAAIDAAERDAAAIGAAIYAAAYAAEQGGPDAALIVTPAWAKILPMLRQLIERGGPDGARAAWDEIGRALALADERNAMAGALESLAICGHEMAEHVGEPGSMGRDELDSALARAGELLESAGSKGQ